MQTQMMDNRYMLNRVPLTDVLEGLKQAKVCEFTTMAATESRRKYGVEGQSLEQVFPLAVTRDGLGNVHLDTAALVPVLIQAVIELSAKVEALECKRGRKKATEPASADEVLAQSGVSV